jgi:Na+/phosphate symporter
LQASKQSTESEIEKQAREIVELSAKVKQLTQQLDEYKVRALSNQDAL